MLSGMRKNHPTDLSDKEWARLKPYLLAAKLMIFDAVFYKS